MYGTRRKLGLRVCVGAAGAVMVLSGVAAIQADRLPAELQPGALKIDPDAGLIATPYDGPAPFELPEDDLRAGLRTDECFTLAYPDVQFADQTRKWRGNLITVNRQRKLNKLQAWLKIDNGANAHVYFFVYKRLPSAQYCELYQESVTLPGDGTWKYYNSGNITSNGADLILEPGITTIYLIGIAWGTDSISYARETRSGAFSYGEGTVVASSGLNNVTPPLAECFYITQADNVYVINPCFEPLPGACCTPDNTCVDVANEAACNQLDGEFAAPGVICGTDCGTEVTQCPMPKGRCCIPPEGCFYSNYWECTIEEGGTSWTEGENCDLPNECFPPEGACCLFDGSCVEVTDSECSALNGQYTGDYSFCESTYCEVTGACCTREEGCVQRSQALCNQSSGAVYKGDGSHCWDEAQGFPVDPCDETLGACCYYDGFCEYVTRFECEVDLTGTYTPGIWQGAGVSCEAAQCKAQAACCTGTTSCSDMDLDEFDACTNGNPEWGWYPGRPCQYDPCSDVGQVGACCVLGECTIANRIDCETPPENGGLGGVYVDAGSNGWQACKAAFVDCKTENGDEGACCVGDDDCRILTEQQCTNSNGFYHGDGVPCSTYLCTKGICCGADGELPCSTLYPLECEAKNGDRGPLGAACTPNACDTGACCMGTDGNECVEVREFECEMPISQGGLNGEFQGPGTDCTPNPCVGGPAACCLGDACATLDEATCADFGGVYQGEGTVCGSDGCDTGACCTPLADCRITTKAACVYEEASTNAFQGKDTTCSPNPCPLPTGACCVDGLCTEETEAECTGAYAGDLTTCAEVSCDLGACCTPDGADCLDLTTFECASMGGSFHGEADCQTGEAVCYAPCCFNDESCQDMYPALCGPQGGYAGQVGQTCASNGFELCTEGACCISEVFCNLRGELRCLAEGGIPTDPGVPCNPSPCQPGACCDYAGGCQDNLINAQCDDIPGGVFLLGDTCTPDPCGPFNVCDGLPFHDFDTNGTVDLKDYYFLQQCFGQTSPIECLCVFDEDRNGVIDLDDVPGFLSDLDLGGPPTDPVGACCDTNAYVCSDSVFEIHCQGPDEVWTEGTLCADLVPPCLPTGACCDLLGACINGLYQADCDQVSGGVFFAGQDCGTVVCEACTNSVPGNRPSDFDGDMDIDLADFYAFQECFGSSPTTECLCIFDANLDGVIDPNDLAQFESDLELSGPT